MSKLRSTQGFTLIELLIVVVIIGILAAIAIPQFASTKEKAYDAAAKSDIRNLQTTEEAYFADNQAYWAGGVSAATNGGTALIGNTTFQASPQVALTATTATNGYTIVAKHTNSPSSWCINTTPAGNGSIEQVASC